VTTRACHHIGLRVANLEKSVDFYVETLGGTQLSLPFVMEGDYAEMVMQGPPGTRYRIAHIGFDEGAFELFEFLDPVNPTGLSPSNAGSLIHVAVQVKNFASTRSSVDTAGGRRLFPDVAEWRDMRICYVVDLDGNVIELIDRSMDDCVRYSIEVYPEANPAGDGRPSDVPFSERGVSVG
jgi:catechol 2,3-dioxygenase-like lactoylglutathione lyase family enzyme